MKTTVKKESPAFTLQASDYNESFPAVSVSFAELRSAEVGARWYATAGSCGRDVCEESAEVVYKTAEGCAVLFRRSGTTDSPNPESWEDEPRLTWFEFQ